MQGVADHMYGFYRRALPESAGNKEALTGAAISVLQEVYKRNIHHEMNISWETYPSQIGHRGSRGCFRCHNPNLIDHSGRSIPYDCSLCHSMLAYESKEPFRFLQMPDPASRDYHMHRYLQEEFLKSIGSRR